MGFLDIEGLEYFYNKLKNTPVALAENLINEEASISEDSFIYRTSAGDKNIDSGNAFLYSIKGNAKVTGEVAESITPISTNGLDASVSLDTWKTQFSTTTTQVFTYTANTFSGNSYVTSAEADEVWRDSSNNIILLSTYGITVSNLVKTSLSISTDSSEITVSFKPAVYVSAIGTLSSGTTTFNYDIDAQKWYLNGSQVTPNTYGIQITGTITEDTSFSITCSLGTSSGQLIISYVAHQYGSITIATPSKFVSTGFNQFDYTNTDFIISHATISDGSIVALDTTDAGYDQKYVCFCKEVPGADYGYIAYSKTSQIDGIGWCTSEPTIGTELNVTQTDKDKNTSKCASIQPTEEGYLVVATRNYSDLCIHTRWDTEEDEVFERYEAPDEIIFPTKSTENEALPLGSYGMPAVGSVADELDLENGFYIKRIGKIGIEYLPSIGEAAYITDGTNVYYVLATPSSYLIDVKSSYVVNDFGTEEFTNTTLPIDATVGYTENLRNKLKGDVLTISKQDEQLEAESLENAMWNLGWTVARTWGEN